MDTTNADALDRADMERLVAGHDAALNALLERHGQTIHLFLARMLHSEDDAADLAQETFVRVYRACASYRPQQSFRTWLFTIAANLARNQLRWRARHRNVSLDAESEGADTTLSEVLPAQGLSPFQAAATAERATAVRAAVHALPLDLREAIVLCEWEDLPVAEAAAILNTTPKTVESRLYRARHLLRTRLKRWL